MLQPKESNSKTHFWISLMKNSTTFKSKSKIKRSDDSELSKNHSKSVKYRLRIQQQKEADKLIKDFKENDDTRSDQ